ncbi:hypothetical protein J7I84_08950 [Arthrobacter sp. ISL-85]|uniref:hypothetical protein n=1 Tax=Arthrobacter sp. ISL-85 TaxID=2819115 RepID=UPI001BEA310E|nr:hypothetical protein [Arthrobacter sp. ISL-85]MBT2566620.1 hypothetical protein [Arthrobacter sp. ISL-85]
MSTEAKSLTGILEDLWDGGNATGLDGWIGPGRGAGEVDDQAIWNRDRDVEKALAAVTLAGSQVLVEVADERGRQTAKWGQQDHPNGTGPAKLPMPYGSGSWSAAVAAERLKLITECSAQVGLCTWLHILREEVFEAFAEDDPAKLRAELIQVAAVAVQWVEAIDRGKQ